MSSKSISHMVLSKFILKLSFPQKGCLELNREMMSQNRSGNKKKKKKKKEEKKKKKNKEEQDKEEKEKQQLAFIPSLIL